MKHPLLIGGLLMMLVIAFPWSRHDSVAQPATEAASAPRLKTMAPNVDSPLVSAVSPAKPKLDAQPVTDSYLAVFDAQDVKLVVDNILKSGTADQKGWAATLVQECGTVLNSPDSVRNAKDSGDAAKAAFRELIHRCAGFENVASADLKALRNKLRTDAKDSSSDYAKLHLLSDRADAGDTRWSTVDQAFIARSLHSGDPVLEYAALDAIISCIDRNIVGGDDRSLALRMVQGQMIEGRRGRVTELMFCASGAMCNASGTPPTDATTPGMLRLERAYRSALESKSSPGQLLAIR